MTLQLVVLVAEVPHLLERYTSLVITKSLVLSLVIIVLLTKTMLVGPCVRVHLLTIMVAIILMVVVAVNVAGAPTLLLLASGICCVLPVVVSGIICLEAIQLGHVAHLVDWFPLDFAF